MSEEGSVEVEIPESENIEESSVETSSVETSSVETPSVETPSVETPSAETPSVEKEVPLFQEIKIEEFGGELTDIQKNFFVSDGKITVYQNDKGEKKPTFSALNKRLTCIEKFLSFYSQRIGELLLESSKNENDEGKSFLFLEYNGDEEVLDSMTNATENAGRLDINNISAFIKRLESQTEKSNEDSIILENIKSIQNSKMNDEGFYPVFICVRRHNMKDFLYTNLIKVNPLQLYTESLLPWLVKVSNKENNEGSEKKVWVNLSMFQKKYADEDKLVYYKTSEGLEPAIIKEDEKSKLINTIIKNCKDSQMFTSKKYQAIAFDFGNGFRDVLSLYAGIRTKTTTIRFCDLASFSKDPFYNKIKEDFDNGYTPLLFFVYAPKTKNIIDLSYVPYKE